MMRCRSLAEMPLRRALISKIARNHVLKGLSRLLQQRARRQARLVAAIRTLKQEAVALAPQSRRATARTHGRVAPARLDPVGATVFFGRKPGLELARRLREVTPQTVLGLPRH